MHDATWALDMGGITVLEAMGGTPKLLQQTGFSRANPAPRSYVRVNGGGLEANIELGVDLTPGQIFSFRGVSVKAFDAATQKRNLFCTGSDTLPLKPTNAVLRTWVIGGGSPPSMTVSPSCSTLKDCSGCVLGERLGGRCEWVVTSQRCAARGSAAAVGERAITDCNAGVDPIGEPNKLAEIERANMPVVFGAILGTFLLCACAAAVLFRKRKSGAEVLWGREMALGKWESEYEEGRRGDTGMAPARRWEREGDGTVRYEKEVMAERVEDEATPVHELDEEARTRHLRKHCGGKQELGRSRASKGGRRLSVTSLGWKE